MKKYFLTALTILGLVTANAQSRGIRIAYIDMEYILEKVPDYAEATNQLEQRAQKWKQEMDVKRNEIDKLKDGLKAEMSLLTKELIEEREEEIAYMEKELMDYQLKRFGPTGDLITQKSVLVKPIQDQVFTIIQDLAEAKKYDFVFDKSSDLTMMFAAQRHDISDLVVRRLTRTANRERLSNKEIKKLEEQEAQEELEMDPEYQERQQKLEDRKTEREERLEARKLAQEEKRRAYEERREQLLREREAKRNGTTVPPANNRTPATGEGDINDTDDAPPTANRPAAGTPATGNNDGGVIQGDNKTEVKTTATDKPEEGDAETVDKLNAAQDAKDERAARLEARKKAQEERKQKILADREAARLAREEQKNKAKEEQEAPQEEEESE